MACLLLVACVIPHGPKILAAALDFTALSDGRRKRRFLAVTGLAAAFLSIGYVGFYLHGGPRASEAPIYWLQGRAMSHGAFGWAVPSPTASYRGAGLVAASPARLSSIAPPGYPMLLALTFLVGAPMLTGPVLAGALVLATWWLAGEVSLDDGTSPASPGRGRDLADGAAARSQHVAGVAAGLSVICVALRRQTADTLPHGAAALAIAIALASALRGRRLGEARLFAVAGLALGWLASIEPRSAIAPSLVVAILIAGSAPRPRALAWALLAAVPGAALLLAANHAATGHTLALPAAIYAKAVSDTPTPRLGEPLDVAAALRALRAHAMDVANFEPLALAAIPALVRRKMSSAPVLAALLVGGHFVLAKGSILPGAQGEASSMQLSEILPLEHCLVAAGLAVAAGRALGRVATATLGLAFAGFALHASHAHAELAAGGMGRPRFEPDVLQQANVTSGLLFFDDDQGYELAGNPGVEAGHGIQAVRMKNDDHDRFVYDVSGHPPSYRYIAGGAASAFAVPWSPPSLGSDVWRFEAESDWPPLAVSNGFVQRLDVAESCASGGSVLALVPRGDAEATATLELAVPPPAGAAAARRWTLTPRVYQTGYVTDASLDVVEGLEASQGWRGRTLAHWSWRGEEGGRSCYDLTPTAVELGPRARLVLTARRGPAALDRTLLR